VNAAGGALKARVPVRPKAPASANKQPITPDFDPPEDRTVTPENAGYMVAGA
jgi:hypothetical protein